MRSRSNSAPTSTSQSLNKMKGKGKIRVTSTKKTSKPSSTRKSAKADKAAKAEKSQTGSSALDALLREAFPHVDAIHPIARGALLVMAPSLSMRKRGALAITLVHDPGHDQAPVNAETLRQHALRIDIIGNERGPLLRFQAGGPCSSAPTEKLEIPAHNHPSLAERPISEDLAPESESRPTRFGQPATHEVETPTEDHEDGRGPS